MWINMEDFPFIVKVLRKIASLINYESQFNFYKISTKADFLTIIKLYKNFYQSIYKIEWRLEKRYTATQWTKIANTTEYFFWG